MGVKGIVDRMTVLARAKPKRATPQTLIVESLSTGQAKVIGTRPLEPDAIPPEITAITDWLDKPVV